MRFCAEAKVKQAEVRLTEAVTVKARAMAMQAVWKARGKAAPSSIERSVFSHCIFELENAVLAAIDVHFRENGWTVGSLIYDGVLVEHRSDAGLKDAMRGAEERVRAEVGYTIKLTEKPLSWLGLSYDQELWKSEDDHVQAALNEMAETQTQCNEDLED